jgi:hypothetical protein
MTNELQFFDAAKAALAKAVKVDEVKKIHDMAAAKEAAAKIAKDKSLEADAVEIRMRAERRLGELMEQQKKSFGLNKGGGDQRSKHRDSKKPGGNANATLAEAGIDKNLANRARKARNPSDEEFEATISAAKERVTTLPIKPEVANKESKPEKVVMIGSAVDQCVDKVRATIEDTLRRLKRGKAKDEKLLALFAALKELIEELKPKTLPTAEPSAQIR